MRSAILFSVLTFVAASLYGQQEVRLFHGQSIHKFDHDNARWQDRDFTLQTTGVSFGTFFGRRFSLRSSLSLTRIEQTNLKDEFRLLALCECTCCPDWREPHNLQQLELSFDGRFTIWDTGKFSWFAGLEFTQSALLNDHRQESPTFFGDRYDSEVLSLAYAYSSGGRFYLGGQLSVELELKRRRYVRHNFLDNAERTWYFAPMLAVVYHLD